MADSIEARMDHPESVSEITLWSWANTLRQDARRIAEADTAEPASEEHDPAGIEFYRPVPPTEEQDETDNRERLAERMREVADSLIASQKPLPADMAEVLYDNIDELYEGQDDTASEGKACETCGQAPVERCRNGLIHPKHPAGLIPYAHECPQNPRGRTVAGQPATRTTEKLNPPDVSDLQNLILGEASEKREWMADVLDEVRDAFHCSEAPSDFPRFLAKRAAALRGEGGE